jgi:hypothetical protein
MISLCFVGPGVALRTAGSEFVSGIAGRERGNRARDILAEGCEEALKVG